jgi:hypothetical protein
MELKSGLRDACNDQDGLQRSERQVPGDGSSAWLENTSFNGKNGKGAALEISILIGNEGSLRRVCLCGSKRFVPKGRQNSCEEQNIGGGISNG